MISYYGTDCDMHSRLAMNGLTTPIADAGQIFDVGKSLPNLEVLFRRVKKGEKMVERQYEESDEKTVINVGKGGKIDVEDPRKPVGDLAHGASNSTSDVPVGSSEPVWTPEPNKKFFDTTEEDSIGSENWKQLQITLEAMAEEKRTDPYRNSWQLRQKGGQGEPFYYDAEGWEKALQMTIDTGMKIFEEKWGHRGCDTHQVGLKEGDQWRVEHDWYDS